MESPTETTSTPRPHATMAPEFDLVCGEPRETTIDDAPLRAFEPTAAANAGLLRSVWRNGRVPRGRLPPLRVAMAAPALDVDGAGVAYVGFFHHLTNGDNEYWVAAHDGSTMHGPIRVNKTPIGFQGLNLDLGHYMGMAGLEHGALSVWVWGEAPSTDLRAAFVGLNEV